MLTAHIHHLKYWSPCHLQSPGVLRVPCGNAQKIMRQTPAQDNILCCATGTWAFLRYLEIFLAFFMIVIIPKWSFFSNTWLVNYWMHGKSGSCHTTGGWWYSPNVLASTLGSQGHQPLLAFNTHYLRFFQHPVSAHHRQGPGWSSNSPE